MVILLKDNWEILESDRKCISALTASLVSRNATQGPWCTVSIHAFSAITPLVLAVKTCTVAALSAQPVSVHPAEPQRPDGKAGERDLVVSHGTAPHYTDMETCPSILFTIH